MASEDAGWKRGVAGSATHRRDAGQTCCTSHLPPEIPRPAPRGVLRAAVGRSSDSWMRQAFALPPRSRLPGTAVPVGVATSSPPTAAGQCRDGSCIPRNADRTGFPFHPTACGLRNRPPQHIGPDAIRQSTSSGSPASPRRHWRAAGARANRSRVQASRSREYGLSAATSERWSSPGYSR